MTTERPLRIRTSALLAALALTSLGACAQATPPTPSASGPMAGMPHAHMHAAAERGERMGQRYERHLDALKAKLQLSAAQESAWTGFASTLKERPAHSADHLAQHQALMQLSTPERLEHMKALRTQHQAEMNTTMDRHMEATRSFYATLTPEQKKVFDTETARLMQGIGRHGNAPYGGHHGGPMHGRG